MKVPTPNIKHKYFRGINEGHTIDFLKLLELIRNYIDTPFIVYYGFLKGFKKSVVNNTRVYCLLRIS